jgi:hypothetical protein
MADYDVDDWTETASTLPACLALLETKLETIVNTKTIRLVDVVKDGNQWSYYLIVDAA